MKKTILLAFLTSILFSVIYGQPLSKNENNLFRGINEHSRSRSVFTYTLTTLTEPYNNLTGATSLNNGEIWDEPDYVVPISFPFYILDTEITYLQLGAGSGAAFMAPTEDPDIMLIVFPFETDLIDRGYNEDIESLSPISYKVEGSAGNHILKIEFNNAGSYYDDDLLMYINFQMWLFENNNRIEFHFGPNFINDPDIFYDGEPGAYIGLAAYNEVEDLITDPHFITGQAGNPSLSTNTTPITGTPVNGTVYRLSLNEPLVVTVTGEDATSFCSPNGTATANVSGGTSPYTYHWNNGATTSTITNLNGGTYSVTVTDASAMTATDNITITIPNPIVVNASATNETSVNANDGTAIALPTDGLPPFGWEWSNGSAGFEIVDLAPGIYTVTITDEAGCTASQSVVVNAFGCPPLEIISSVLDVTCHGLCDGVIQINDVDQGVSPFTYMWSNGSASSFISNLCDGDYDVTVTDANGCIVNATYHITEPPQLFVSTASTTETGPGAGDGTAWAIPSGGTVPYSYSWSNGGIDSLITGLVPGTYSVTVTDGNMCSATSTVVVNIFTCTTVEGTIVNNTCFESCDGSITITLNNSIPPIAYLWDDGSTLSSISDLCTGSYSVTATDATGCSASAIFTVSQPPSLFAQAFSTNETAFGANDGTAWTTPFGGTPPYSYQWDNGGIDSLIINLSPGTFSVTVTDAHGCTEEDIVEVGAFPCAGVTDFFYEDPSCYGSCDGYGVALVSDTSSVITYLWNTGDTTSFLNDLCDGSYSLTITNENLGCEDGFSFEIHSPDSLILVVDQIIHVTDTTIASASIHGEGGTMPYEYLWSGPGGFIIFADHISDVPPGTYFVEIIDDHGCSVTDSILIEDNSTVGISDPGHSKITMYPNPATGLVHINVDELNGFQIDLYGFDGQILHSWKNVNTIDVTDLVQGIYVVRMAYGKEYFIERLVIIR